MCSPVHPPLVPKASVRLADQRQEGTPGRSDREQYRHRAIAGARARLIVPSRQDRSIVMTILLGSVLWSAGSSASCCSTRSRRTPTSDAYGHHQQRRRVAPTKGAHGGHRHSRVWWLLPAPQRPTMASPAFPLVRPLFAHRRAAVGNRTPDLLIPHEAITRRHRDPTRVR